MRRTVMTGIGPVTPVGTDPPVGTEMWRRRALPAYRDWARRLGRPLHAVAVDRNPPVLSCARLEPGATGAARVMPWRGNPRRWQLDMTETRRNSAAECVYFRNTPARRNTMNIERSVVAERYPVLRLSGELDLSSVPDVRRSIRGLIEEGQVRFLINLSNLDFIDSSGLGVLVGGLARVREKQGEIKIVCANRRILRVFEMTRLTQLFEIYPDEEAGARDFQLSEAPGEQAA